MFRILRDKLRAGASGSMSGYPLIFRCRRLGFFRGSEGDKTFDATGGGIVGIAVLMLEGVGQRIMVDLNAAERV